MKFTTNENLAQNWEPALRRVIIDYPQREKKHWQRDYSSIENYTNSVRENREAWADITRFPIFPDLTPQIEMEKIGRNLFSIELQLFEDLKLSALYSQPDSEKFKEPFPIVICLHGMGGTPEMVLGLDARLDHSYHQFGQKLADKGFAVIAPALINNFSDRARINRLALLMGSSVWGLEIQHIRSLLDVVVANLPIDPEMIGMWGISMGGAYTLYTMPLDFRIKAGIITAWFNKRIEKMIVESADYTCFLSTEEEHAFLPGLLTQFSDKELVSLICPRPLQIQTGDKDDVAAPSLVKQEYASARTHYSNLKIEERLEWILHHGVHEIEFEHGLNFLIKWM